jgi:RNA polymerase sigma-70 factor (ECF subfamily)
MTAIAFPASANLVRTRPAQLKPRPAQVDVDIRALGVHNGSVTLLEEQDDVTLLEIIRRNDRGGAEAALEALYRRHSRNVYSLARRIVRDEAATEEIVQDAFMKLWKNAGVFDASRGSLSTWLLTITHHASVDHLRRVTSKPVSYPEDPVLEAIPDNTKRHDHLETVILDAALTRLRPEERELIELAYYEGLTHAQTAARTGLPLGTVKTRLRATLARLRDHLEPA